MAGENAVVYDPPPVIIKDAGNPPTPPTEAAPVVGADPAAPPAPVDADTDFSNMFAQFAKTPEDLDATTQPQPAVTNVETPEDAAAAAAAAAQPQGAAPPAQTPPAAPPPPAAPAAAEPDGINRLADMLAQRLQPQAPAAPAAPARPQIGFSPQEAQAIQTYYQEWPEVAQAQEIIVRNAVRQTADHIFSEVARIMGPKMALLEELANNQQFDYLDRRIPDYTTIQDKVVDWISKQPDYLQSAYTTVMERGTPDQVESLIGRFRQETGTAAPPPIAPAGGAASPAPAPTAPLSPAAKKAVAALAPVGSKRTGPTQAEPQTYDDAFAAFAKAG